MHWYRPDSFLLTKELYCLCRFWKFGCGTTCSKLWEMEPVPTWTPSFKYCFNDWSFLEDLHAKTRSPPASLPYPPATTLLSITLPLPSTPPLACEWPASGHGPFRVWLSTGKKLPLDITKLFEVSCVQVGFSWESCEDTKKPATQIRVNWHRLRTERKTGMFENTWMTCSISDYTKEQTEQKEFHGWLHGCGLDILLLINNFSPFRTSQGSYRYKEICVSRAFP